MQHPRDENHWTYSCRRKVYPLGSLIWSGQPIGPTFWGEDPLSRPCNPTNNLCLREGGNGPLKGSRLVSWSFNCMEKFELMWLGCVESSLVFVVISFPPYLSLNFFFFDQHCSKFRGHILNFFGDKDDSVYCAKARWHWRQNDHKISNSINQ